MHVADTMEDKGIKRVISIFKYSDSEPNEVFTSVLHTFILPAALYTEMFSSPWLCLVSMACGVYQGYAVLWNGNLGVRGLAVKIAFLVAVATVINYLMEGMLHGSNMGWLLVLVFSGWNIIRVENQKHIEEIKKSYAK